MHLSCHRHLEVLTSVKATRSNNVITFAIATAGTNIKSETITFPAGFNVASANLIEQVGISTPGTFSIAGQTLKYTFQETFISAGTKIMFMEAR